jgi:hypothetical protein
MRVLWNIFILVAKKNNYNPKLMWTYMFHWPRFGLMTPWEQIEHGFQDSLLDKLRNE